MINKINIRNGLLVFVFLWINTSMRSQVLDTISPTVIASAGGHDTLNMAILGNISISYTVGEVFTTTVAAASTPFIVTHLTQGFHQPSNSANTLSVNVVGTNSSCIGADNGSFMIMPVTSTGTVQYSWNGGVFSNLNLFSNLPPGIYYYQITDGSFTITDSVVISEDQIDCGAQLVFYNGITPNGDGNNEVWIIDGITNFTENNVSIFNRWGDLVWRQKDYNNVDKVWDGNNTGGKPLPDATYFYVIEAGDKVYKGWVELTH